MWSIRIHRLIFEEDFKNIPFVQQKHILSVIQKKLSVDPRAYGKPLTGPFVGYWRLRVEDYRVIYRIIQDRVIVSVIKVGIRKDDKVYQELFARLRKL
ncbi:MAG: hypothetical protein A2Z88_01825 [Omnitrophica WOR_2 bacterium GWA2_47_8]|nr:MAG: hypothetical protein A2Z88_01825 [Omnitrophica WOR_2 bacterium GWA2_47_8]